MRSHFLSVTGAICAIAVAALVRAAEAPTGGALEETVVTATRTAAPVDQLAVPVVIITREEIERSLATDVGELLKQHAGFEVARNGGPGQTASLFIRGTNSDHAVVLVDGVRINPGTIGGAAIQNIAPETIEHIEVVKGPRSSLYGTDAIGGVVNLFTRAQARQGFSGALSGGRYGTDAAHFEGGSPLGERASFGFSIGRLESSGFPALAASAEDRGYSNTTANLYGQFSAAGSLLLRARAWRAAGNTQYSDFMLAPVDEDYTNSAYALEAQLTPRAALRTRLTASRVADDVRQKQSEDFVRTRRDAFEWQTDWRAGAGHEITAGAMLTRENTQARSFGTRFDIDTDVNMGFLQDRWNRGRHGALAAIGYASHHSFGHKTTWNAEYGVTLGRGTRLSAAAGTAFHAPDSTDRFGYGGNPALAPETSMQLELGVRQPLGPRQLLWLTAFRNDIDDLIVFAVTDFTTFDGRNQNVERARIDGLEAGYEFRADLWRVRAEIALQDPRNRTTGEQLLRRARQTLAVSAGRTLGRLELGVDLQASGRRLDFGFPGPTRLDPYVLVDLSTRYAVSDQWSLQARLDNVLDERYQLASGYNTPGRSFNVATRYRFR
ncbi:MAG: TonB-dependent receptor [Steroidobacteraceae bacterium]